MAKKQKPVNLDDIDLGCTSKNKLTVKFEPKSPGQKRAVELWKRSRVLFLLGPAGTGKTSVSFGLALLEAMKSAERSKIMLTRPMVTVDEELGLLPGDVNEKIMPWLLPFADVLGQMTFSTLEELSKVVDVEPVPLGMLRGRTIRNGTLICSEMQNATYEQIKCAITRMGSNARIIIEGDPEQSDCYSYRDSPLVEIAYKLHKALDTVSLVEFDPYTDQMRDPLISDILDLI